MEDPTPDVKPTDDSSSTAVAPEVQDDTVAPSPTPEQPVEAEGVKPQEQATPPTLDDALNKGVDDIKPAKVEQAEKPVDSTPDAKAEPAPGATKPDDDASLPFGKHPRFQQLVAEKNEHKQWREQNEPIVQQAKQVHQFRSRYNINDQQFQQALELVALINTDPAKAREQLKPIVDVLDNYVGAKLDKDLEDEVAAGAMPQERASELQRLRAHQRRSGVELQQQQQQQQAFIQQQMMAGVNQWVQTKRAVDPDFKPKANGGPDGKWEMVDAKLNSLWMQQPPATPQDAAALAERAYGEVSAFLSRYQPAKPAVKPLLSTRSVSSVAKKPRSVDDAIDDVIARL